MTEGRAKKASGEWESPGRARWHHGGGWGRSRSWWSFPFGLIGPIIGAAIGLLFIIISLWALSFLNAAVQSQFLSLLIASVGANIWVFFAFSLAMGYLDFAMKRSDLARWLLMPVSTGAGIAFAAWILAWVLRTIGSLSGTPILVQIGLSLRANLAAVFVIFLVLGYAALWLAKRRW